MNKGSFAGNVSQDGFAQTWSWNSGFSQVENETKRVFNTVTREGVLALVKPAGVC